MNSYEQLNFPKIDYKFWADKNNFFPKDEIPTTIKSGITSAKKGGLIGNLKLISANDINLQIEARIKNFNLEESQENELLIIFDLIQAWGGANGRRPYQKGAERITNANNFALAYRNKISLFIQKGSGHSFNESEVNFLEKEMLLPGVRLPFFSKHMYFWSKNRPEINKIFNIYDSRMEFIFRAFNKNKRMSYFNFLSIIQMIEANYKIKTGEAETAIFAFSNNFFDNKGTLKDSFEYENDLDEAIRIMKNISKS